MQVSFGMEFSQRAMGAMLTETLVKRKLLIGRASGTNYFMSIHILRFNVQLSKLIEAR